MTISGAILLLCAVNLAEAARPQPAAWHPRPVRTVVDDLAIWHPASMRDGRLMVVEVETAAGCDAPRVRWGTLSLPAYRVAERWQALVPIRLGSRPGRRFAWVSCGGRKRRFEVDIHAGTYAEATLRVDPQFTRAPPPRAATESKRIDTALAVVTHGRLWHQSFLRPSSGPETSGFGVRRTFNGEQKSRHRGIDIDGAVGAPVHAANSGVVLLAARGYYYTGNAIFIDHGDQMTSMYFHLSRVDVEEGQRVRRGQLIGAVGKSGRVTGPHLHFGIKLAGVYVDPADLLAFNAGVLLSTGEAAVGADATAR